ncbi:MAG: cation transporter [Desulfuromonas sp.]|nr:MAG: cation transporter [Desulfuromonas sp.]
MASGSKKVIYAALIGNTLVAITKFIAAVITGSAAMLAEGIHSVVDTGNQVLLLYGLKQAKKPADELYPFGHGKEVYFWSFVVAILIFGLGGGISMYEGVGRLLHPQPVEKSLVSYFVLGLAMLFEGAALFFALTEFSRAKGKWGYIEAVQRGKDPTLFVVLFEDSAALLGLAVAFFGVLLADLTGDPVYDALASVLIGLLLFGTAAWLAYETKGLLIGERAQIRVVREIRELIYRNDGVGNVNEILTLHMGPDYILANISINFDDSLTSNQLEKLVAEIDRQIRTAQPEVKKVFIEAEAMVNVELEESYKDE